MANILARNALRRRPPFADLFLIAFLLPNHLYRELDLPRWRRCRGQHSGRAIVGGILRSPRLVENICIVGYYGQRKVGVVEYIENLGTELNIEGLRNSPDGIVLENREIEVYKARSGDDVASGIASQIETPQIIRIRGSRAAESRIAAERCRCIEEGQVRRGRHRKTLSLDVVIGISRVIK